MNNIDLLAMSQVYAAQYASPHHITFTIDGLKNLVAAIEAAKAQPRVIEALEATSKIINQRDELLAALVGVRRILQTAKDTSNGPIWNGPGETLFDFIDAAIESGKGAK